MVRHGARWRRSAGVVCLAAICSAFALGASPFQEAATNTGRRVPFFNQLRWYDGLDNLPHVYVTESLPGMTFYTSDKDILYIDALPHHAIKYGLFDNRLAVVMVGVSEYERVFSSLINHFGVADTTSETTSTWRRGETVIEFSLSGLVMVNERLWGEWMASQEFEAP